MAQCWHLEANVVNIFRNAEVYDFWPHWYTTDKDGNLQNLLCFTVEDSACGMTSDYLKYSLFAPFSQETSILPEWDQARPSSNS